MQQPTIDAQGFINNLPQMVTNVMLRRAQLKDELEKVEKQLSELNLLQQGVNLSKEATDANAQVAPEYTEQDAE